MGPVGAVGTSEASSGKCAARIFFFFGEGRKGEVLTLRLRNLCLILKIMLQNRVVNVTVTTTLFATAFIYIQM
jgi:hypothetical protein